MTYQIWSYLSAGSFKGYFEQAIGPWEVAARLQIPSGSIRIYDIFKCICVTYQCLPPFGSVRTLRDFAGFYSGKPSIQL